MDPAQAPAAIEFGRFSVLPHRREVLADGRPLDLGGRAFDVLMVLIEASGDVVSKDALMKGVWPDRIVEENSLQSQISALRRTFAADRNLVRTIAGRGYQFTGVIHRVSARPDAQATAVGMPQPTPAPARPPTNLPEPVSELIGRDADLDGILGLSASHRLVTLVGAGGIGKTRLGFEVARHLLPRFTDGVWAIELAPLSDPELVPVTVATALGLELTSGTASPLSVANALRSQQLMLVLDNCEHVVDAAARMAESLLRASPTVRVIATSREPLRVEGEWVYLVPPLAVPREGSPDSEDPLLYSAVRLFDERARAAAPFFSPDARVAAAMAGICRRLDGIPLAIELAAARVAALGIEGISTLLHDRFRLLAGGHRTALPRHQTLRATLDWSYELLTEPERVVLRRLAIFAGSFTRPAASAVTANDGVAAPEVVDCVASLVAKSLVTADAGGANVRYRLLETTRAYALEKLVQAGEFDDVSQRHARYYLDLFAGADAEAESRPTEDWLADHVPRMDDLRAALDWAFSPGGDASIGVALTAAAVPLWSHLSLMEECRGRVERALAAIPAEAGRDARCEMQLRTALAISLIYTRGAVPEIGPLATRALENAESLGNTEYQLRSLWSLWSFRRSIGQQRAALTLAQRFHTLAANGSDPNDCLIGDQLIGVSQHYLGDLSSARRHIERVLAHYVAPARNSLARFKIDQRASAQVYLARILWLQGMPDQAMRAAASSVADSRAINHAMSLAHALAMAACPIALWVGDLAAAEHYIQMLIDDFTTPALARGRAFGLGYQGVLVIRRGDLGTGLRLLRAVFDEPGGAGGARRHFAYLMAETMGRAGQIADGLTAIEEAIVRSERTEERWATAEMLRIKGDLLLIQGTSEAAAVAEGYFRQALDLARRQGALSWELRAATSLARLLSDHGRRADAAAFLQPIYDRFTEGFATTDLKTANALLGDLS